MLSITSQYALRSLAHLSRMPARSSILGNELAGLTGVPYPYLSKILVALRNAGMVETARGRGGGYRLIKKPNKIKLIDVIALFERPWDEPPCLLGGNKKCNNNNPCSAHKAWNKVINSYLDFLKNNTVQDIANGEI